MPIYEQDPKELLGEDIQQIAAPDDSNFYMETPSLLSAVNPFTSEQLARHEQRNCVDLEVHRKYQAVDHA